MPRTLDSLEYGGTLSLAEARLLLTKARRAVEMGESPAKAKAEGKSRSSEALAFGGWADKFFEEADLADSTKAMRRSIYERDLKKTFGRLKLASHNEPGRAPGFSLRACPQFNAPSSCADRAWHIRPAP